MNSCKNKHIRINIILYPTCLLKIKSRINTFFKHFSLNLSCNKETIPKVRFTLRVKILSRETSCNIYVCLL